MVVCCRPLTKIFLLICWVPFVLAYLDLSCISYRASYFRNTQPSCNLNFQPLVTVQLHPPPQIGKSPQPTSADLTDLFSRFVVFFCVAKIEG